MITLHKFVPAWGLPDISPFCSKLEIYLRMAGWQYQTKVANSRKAPKQKLPYIEHDGRTLCDSSAIITYLEARADHPLKSPLDAGLSNRDAAASRALQSMLEEHLYFVTVWRRWAQPAGWQVYQPVIANFIPSLGVPAFMGSFVASMIRKDMVKTLNTQGLGRHSPAEIHAQGIALLTAVSDWLGEQPYILGDRPRTLDATVYAFLAGILDVPIEDPIKTFLQNRINLVAYCARMRRQYWQPNE
jgi:glutathione S-transferase